jgi:16S rRNA (guanine(966)-N(2))-methyltransferase RsmD
MPVTCTNISTKRRIKMRIITGKAKGIKLKTLEGDNTRPTAERVKEAVFSMLQFDIEGRSVLDLFAGSGQMALEALSRGASSAVLADRSKEAVAIIKENVQKTRFADSCQVFMADYLDYLKRCCEKFNIILLDPPYAEEFLENSLKMITEIDILESGGIIVAERPVGKELPWDFTGFTRSRDYKYGKTLLTLYRKDQAD